MRVWPGGAWTPIPARSLVLAVPTEAVLDESLVAQLTSPTSRTLSSRKCDEGDRVFTRPDAVTPGVMSGEPEALSVDRIRPG